MFNVWVGALLRLFRSRLVLENLALRRQLAVLKRRHPRPRLDLLDKLFWVAIRRFWSEWRQTLIVVAPETEHTDYSNVLGYEIGYLIAALIKKQDEKSKIDWIDRNWFRPAILGFKGFDLGYLTFLSTQDMLTNRGLAKSVKLVVFVEDQQFVFEYGPEVIEKELK